MEIHPELLPLIETPREDELAPVRADFLRTCERLNLAIDHFDGEQAKQRIDALTALHQACYSPEYSPEASLAYIERCIQYNGFHAFSLTRNEEMLAVSWFDDGKPYPDSVALIIGEFTRRTGSNLVVYSVLSMTHPSLRNQGLSKGLRVLSWDFRNTVYGADALLLTKIERENRSSEKAAKGSGAYPTTLAATGRRPARYWSRPLVPLTPPLGPWVYSRKEPIAAPQAITHFPDHPACDCLGRVAVIHSFAPHHGLRKVLKNSSEKPSDDVVYAFSDVMSFLDKDWSNDPNQSQGYRGLVHMGLTVTDFSIVRSMVHWRDGHIYKVDVQVPQDRLGREELIGRELAPSFIFSNLYVVARAAAKAGHHMLTTKISSEDLLELTRIVNATYPFQLTDFIQVGDHSLQVDYEALRKGSRNGMTTLYIDTDTFTKKLERFSWIASACQTTLDESELYRIE